MGSLTPWPPGRVIRGWSAPAPISSLRVSSWFSLKSSIQFFAQRHNTCRISVSLLYRLTMKTVNRNLSDFFLRPSIMYVFSLMGCRCVRPYVTRIRQSDSQRKHYHAALRVIITRRASTSAVLTLGCVFNLQHQHL